MNDFITFIKKYGATGVLALWLFYTESRLRVIEHKLYECYEKQLANNNIQHDHWQQYAVLIDDKKKYKNLKHG